MKISKESILEEFRRAGRLPDYTWSTYQPINIPGYEITRNCSGRRCFDRAGAIRKHAEKMFPKTSRVIDWGCNNGFFVFEMARAGYPATGMDRDPRMVERCRFLTGEATWATPPEFKEESLHSNAVIRYPADVCICLSVLHHLREACHPTMDAMADTYPNAYLEMDGRNFGMDRMRVYFKQVRELITVQDRYAGGRRTRKTFFCTNAEGGRIYRNLKHVNCLDGRSVFSSAPEGGRPDRVLKRENKAFEHVWVKTNIRTEAELYSENKTSFLPTMYSFEEDSSERRMEIEYLDEGSDKGASLQEIFDWLAENGLRILDFNENQFIRTRHGFVLIDVETVIPADELAGRLKRDTVRIKSPGEQKAVLRRRYGADA